MKQHSYEELMLNQYTTRQFPECVAASQVGQTRNERPNWKTLIFCLALAASMGCGKNETVASVVKEAKGTTNLPSNTNDSQPLLATKKTSATEVSGAAEFSDSAKRYIKSLPLQLDDNFPHDNIRGIESAYVVVDFTGDDPNADLDKSKMISYVATKLQEIGITCTERKQSSDVPTISFRIHAQKLETQSGRITGVSFTVICIVLDEVVIQRGGKLSKVGGILWQDVNTAISPTDSTANAIGVLLNKELTSLVRDMR